MKVIVLKDKKKEKEKKKRESIIAILIKHAKTLKW